jgi:hypothetical protein
MAEPIPSRLDARLERLSKLAGVLLPITVAVVGGVYTYQKDANDKALRKAQDIRDDNQKAFDNTQKQYANPDRAAAALTSGNPSQVRAGLEIYSRKPRHCRPRLDSADSLMAFQRIS